MLGGGTAGFITALTLRRRLPSVAVRLIRSKAIGIIGVGEGTTPAVLTHLFDRKHLGLDVGDFYRAVNPIWKLGIKYVWGPRGSFNYAFGRQLADRLPLPRPVAYYAGADPVDDTVDLLNVAAALMTQGNAFARDPAGLPIINGDHAYHLENRTFVAYLEAQAERAGVTILDDTVVGVDQDERGIRQLRLASGRIESGVVYADCSGFPSELLGKALGEPFVSYKSTLFCDRAVVGGWQRGADEPIQPYTTAQTMDAGWSWRIDHEHLVNRGYVYSSAFVSDDDAAAEFRRANPKVGDTRVVRFRSGRFARFFVKNVFAIGNASGFVEPMEATAIAAVCDQAAAVAAGLANVGRVTPAVRDACNRRNAAYWDAIPRFLAVHYKFNTQRATPFWRAIWADMDLAGAGPIVDYYRQCGPDLTYAEALLDRHDQFGLGSYMMMFLGQNVPHENRWAATPAERAVVDQWRQQRRQVARGGATAEATLAVVRHPGWQWRPGFYDA